MVIGELKVILAASIGDFKSRMKDAMETVRLYGMYAKDNLDKASTSFQSGFKKIGDGIHLAKEKVMSALKIMTIGLTAFVGALGVVSWQGSKYAEELWRAWVDASGKIAASGKDLDKFSSSIINMATKSKFSMIEIANATKLAASFNLDETESLRAVSAAMDYSMGVGEDLTSSIDGISRALLVFKDRHLTAKDAADILAKANIDSRVTAEDMQQSLRALGPIANKLKWDFKDVVAMLAVFKDEGMEGGRIMMGLASVLNDAMDPTSALGKEIEKTGVNIKDSTGKVKDIITLLRDLKTSGADVSLIFNHLNGVIGPGLSNVVDKGASSLQKYLKEFNNINGFSKQLSTTFEKTLPGAFGFFTARLKDLPVVLSLFLKGSLFSLFTPMQTALKDLTNIIDRTDFAKKLDAALTPTFKAMGKWIGNLINKWSDFILNLKPGDIENAVKSIETFFNNLWNTINNITIGIKALAGAIISIGDAIRTIPTSLSKLSTTVIPGFDAITSMFSGNKVNNTTPGNQGMQGQTGESKKEVERRSSTDVIKEVISKSMKIGPEFVNSITTELQNSGKDIEDLNEDIEKTTTEIKDGSKVFMTTIEKQVNSVVGLSDEILDVLVKINNKNLYLQARLEAMERRVAAINASQSNRKGGI